MSFEKSETYLESINLTINITKAFMVEFSDWIDWRKDGVDSLLDVGSGPGNTIRDAIYPLLPNNFSRLMCSDISQSMVELQKEVFKGYDRVSCEVLDIGKMMDVKLTEKLGTFDHVTSFFCLHWVKDQQAAMDNIFSLLKPGGDCLLVIVADSPVFDAILSVCEKPKWKDYFIGWQDFYVFPYRQVNEAKEKGLKFMTKAGFIELKAEIRESMFDFDDENAKENFLRSMPNKYSKKVHPEEEEEIFQDRLKTFNTFKGKSWNKSEEIQKPFFSLILYGKKKK